MEHSLKVLVKRQGGEAAGVVNEAADGFIMELTRRSFTVGPTEGLPCMPRYYNMQIQGVSLFAN